jgi:CRP-like cAMP-binding protein
MEFTKKETIFSQGDAGANVLYIQKGGVRLSVVNETGKEAVVAVLVSSPPHRKYANRRTRRWCETQKGGPRWGYCRSKSRPPKSKMTASRLGVTIEARRWTRLIEFGRFAARDRKNRGEGKPETFTFLGFTHFCGQLNRKRAFIVWRITVKKHQRTTEVGAWLTNTTPFPEIRLSCASLVVALAGCGGAF